ncbi:MAG TPA: CvpA family protein [Dehalococcoidia bacterium]|nr:CvpA family protein [Dehalococcoidia bacterium]
MNQLDIGVVVFCGILALIGLGVGVIRMAFSLAGLIAGVYLAGNFYAKLGAKLAFIPDEGMAKIAAFVIIFFATMLAASLVAGILHKVLQWALLGWVDKLGGFIGGGLFGGIICAALLAIIVKYTELGLASIIAQSSVAAFIVERFPLLLALLPPEFDAVRQFFQ